MRMRLAGHVAHIGEEEEKYAQSFGVKDGKERDH
jgi:hypothetical protein